MYVDLEGNNLSRHGSLSLITILLEKALNWKWVSSSFDVYEQLITYVPIMISNGLGIPRM